MWNNLKSDGYRALHTRSFYVILILSVVLYQMLFTGNGVMNNSVFAQYRYGENTFAEFLYYLPKSGLFILLALLFVGLFATDEYSSGFVKNTYPLHVHKWTLLMERYVFNMIIITVYYLAILLATGIIQLLDPILFGELEPASYIGYVVVQIFILSTVASFLTLITHLTKSRVLIVLISMCFGMMMWYMMMGMLLDFLFKNTDLLQYTMYELMGKLPYTISWDGYGTAILVSIGNMLLYNGISCLILKKKDI